jgi:hypothetical protein
MRKFMMFAAVVGALVCGGWGVGAKEARAEHGYHPSYHGYHGYGGYHHGGYHQGHGYQYGYPYGYQVYRPGIYVDVPYGPSIVIPFYGRTTVHRPGCGCPCCRR